MSRFESQEDAVGCDATGGAKVVDHGLTVEDSKLFGVRASEGGTAVLAQKMEGV
jgi:hypothetical protein